MQFLFDAFIEQLTNNPKSKSIAQREGGEWKYYSSEALEEKIIQLCSGLLSKQLTPGDTIGIISTNCMEWAVADQAISRCGLISVPMYPNATSADYDYIAEHAKVKIVFVSDEMIYQKVQSLEQKGIEVYSFKKLKTTKHWSTLFSTVPCKTELEKIRDSLNEDQLATIIYTSGTTGTPKGVMLSHKNIISNAHSVAEIFKVDKDNIRVLSFLPLCHIFERTALYTYFHLGATIHMIEDLDILAESIKQIKPHYFATVPRLLEKIYEKIMEKGHALTGMKKGLFFWAMQLSEQYQPHQNQGFFYNLKLKLARKLIFTKWQEAMGGNIEFIVSGAAALQTRVARAFWAAEIPILEAYGQTESSPGITFTRNDPMRTRIGCVGETLRNVNIKIAEDGEILAAGPNIMLGYYQNEEATKDTLKQGWLHTGDIGEIVENKFLKITDRKKEIFKTSGGKYIAPQPIENKLCESMYVAQAMVVGESEKFPAALLVVNEETIQTWAKLHHISFNTLQDLLDNQKVKDKFDSELEKAMHGFSNYEKVKKYALLEKPWTIESNELTPTLKLKRKNIHTNYEKQINAFYE